jgi:hypothetical protein
MPYTITWPDRGTYKKFSGHVTMAELLKSLSQVQCHPEFNRFKFSVTDFLEMEKFEFKEGDDKLYAAYVMGGEYTNSKLAVGIVATDSTILGLLKTRYEPLTKYPVSYFSTLEECEKWVQKLTGTAVQFL